MTENLGLGPCLTLSCEAPTSLDSSPRYIGVQNDILCKAPAKGIRRRLSYLPELYRPCLPGSGDAA